MGRITIVVLIAGFALGSCTSSYEPSYKGAKRIKLEDVRFDDADTFYLKDKPVRVLAVDAPEIAHPDIGFHEDQPYGVAAAESTRVWFVRADVIEYLPAGRDRYGRRLAHVFLDGELLAVLLIEHRLGYETVTHFGDSGFPDLAQRVLDASLATPRPPFEQPYRWRQKNRKRADSS